MKLSQVDRVKNILLKEGKISRNYCLDLPYGDKITRLGAIMNVIKNRYDMAIEGKEEGHDFVYYVKNWSKPKEYKYEKVFISGDWIVKKVEIN